MLESTFSLQIQSGSQAGHIYPLTGTSLIIGRYPLADIVIDDTDIAYRHAVLTRGEATYRIADLESDAGTYVNGQRIGAEPVALAPGDIILLGSRFSAAFLKSATDFNAAGNDEAASQTPEVELPAVDLATEPMSPVESPTADLPVIEEGPIESEHEPPVREAENSTSPVVAPVSRQRPPAPTIHAEALPPLPPPQKNKNGRILLITAGCLALLLACCSITLFMYFVGGDWLLNQMGYLP